MEFKGTQGIWAITSKGDCNVYSIGNQNGTVCQTAVAPGIGNETESYNNAILIAYAPELLNAFEDALIGLEWKYENDIENFDKADDEHLCEWRQLMGEIEKALAKNV